MSDVYLFQTNDDGDVDYQNGDLTVDKGIRTATYLSLFGGNRDDGGFIGSNDKQWWANFLEQDRALMYHSETQYLLDTAPLTSAILLRMQDANKRDLQWLIDDERVTIIESIASIPSVNTLQLNIFIDDLELIFVEQLNG